MTLLRNKDGRALTGDREAISLGSSQNSGKMTQKHGLDKPEIRMEEPLLKNTQHQGNSASPSEGINLGLTYAAATKLKDSTMWDNADNGSDLDPEWHGDEDDYEEEEPEEEEDENPYSHNLDVKAGQYITDADLQTQLAHLPPASLTTSEGMRSEALTVDRNIIASRILHLQKHGVIFYTVDFNPTRDYFQDWVFDVICNRMRIQIEQIKVLSRYTFLVVVSSPEEQKQILMEPYLSIGRKMVIAMPWTTNFDANAMKSSRAPVWVDLQMLNPAFEFYANFLLAKVGTVLYAQTHKARSKFSHTRGCVLCNLNEDLVEFINVTIPGVGSYKEDVIYRTLPDTCFGCKQRGHIARHCPQRNSKEKSVQGGAETQGGNQSTNSKKPTEDAEGFQAVGRHTGNQKNDKGKGKDLNSVITPNAFKVLAMENIEDAAEETPAVATKDSQILSQVNVGPEPQKVEIPTTAYPDPGSGSVLKSGETEKNHYKVNAAEARRKLDLASTHGPIIDSKMRPKHQMWN